MHLLRILSLVLCTILVFSCNKKDARSIAEANASELEKYQEYISEVSSGVISVVDPVYVVLQTPVGGWSDNQELSKDILKVSPKVKGKVIAVNNRTISFQPEEKFDDDTAYTFTLNLEDLVKDLKDDLDEEFVFTVTTLKQQFSVITESLQSYSKDWQYIDGTINASDLMDFDTATKLIKATQKGKNISVTLDTSMDTNRQFSFRIDSIQRFDDDSEVEIAWSGKPFDIETEGSATVSIPGKNNFAVISVSVANMDKQFVEVNFSDPLKKNQNFNGLVTISGINTLKYTVDGNVLKVYPQKEVKGTLEVTVFEGIQSTDSYKLKNTYTEKVSFQQPNPEIRLLQSGVILPTSDHLKFNFEAINLRAVEVQVVKIFENNVLQFLQNNNLAGSSNLRSVGRPVAKKLINLQENSALNLSKWNAFAVDLKSLITPDPGAIYRVELKYRKAYSLYKCEGEVAKDVPIDELTDNYDEEEESSFWDNSQSYYNDYDYNWNERDNPCSTSYYRNKKLSANVLASNLGVVVKKGLNHSYMIAVNDILTTNPVQGAKVTFYNYQQQEVGESTTDAEGITGFDADKPAYFAVVEQGKQQTYVKLNDGNALSVSKFDVSGVRLQKGIKGFIYGERGVWRPGDTLFLSFMLNDNANKLPAGHPVKFELRDPYGKVTYQKTKTTGLNNFYEFAVSTSDDAPTGNWQAKVHVGGASFSKAIKIETIKPNRLKIKTTFENDQVLTSNQNVKGNLEVLWLHGAVAKNLQADINVRFTPGKTKFKTFPGYIFDDPTRKFGTEEQEVFNGEISGEGKASFTLKPKLDNKAAGMLRASFITKVYENGGDFSTDVMSKDFSPFNTYVGISTPKGDKARGMLLTDVKHNFDVVSVDQKGNPKSVKDLEVYIYKVNWRWWWDTSADNLSSYNRGAYRDEVFKTKVTTNSSGKATFQFELKYPEWGRYLVRVVDPNGGHATGKIMYIDWPGWAGKSKKNDPSAATMLLFSTDKNTYTVGEKALVTFPSSEGGRALVTVENGTEVLSSQWVVPQKGETKFELPIEELYTPNVYIHITLLQPHGATLNDLPIRLYGVLPIIVENPDTRVQPRLTMPDVLRPEETITIKVGENNKNPMTYSIAIVDEGLLDLTRFKTPNPWNNFYAREALGVKTWDVYDDVIGAYGGSINQIFSIGGDAEAGGSKSKKANRFKPMVIYEGPFELKQGEVRSHTIKIPKYVGSVRTMIVASNAENGAYGSVDKTTPVRKPLMVLSSIPRKITQGEKITIPVTVFAMENKVKNVSVTLKPNKGFKVMNQVERKLYFAQPDEKMVYFDIEVLEGISTTDIEVVASGGGEKASYNVPINIVNPNPVTTEITSIVLEPNSQQEINFEAFGIDQSNMVTIEFSSLPPMNFESRLGTLIRYPHGCIEQTTSAAFPQLYLEEICNVSSEKKQKIQKNIETAINRLKRFIQPNGGMAYWPGGSINDWGTTYAGHFLLEANAQGYVLPIGFKSNWISYQQQQAKRWRSGNNDLAQAYRLYTLALAGNPDIASMNRLRETATLSNNAKIRLAATYGLIGQTTAANQLLNTATIEFSQRKDDYYTYGSIHRSRAMALETLVALDQKAKAQEVAVSLAKELSSKTWMSTQTTAYSLMAMAHYATYVGGKGVDVQYTLNGKTMSANTGKTVAMSQEIRMKKSNTLMLKNNKDNTIFVQLEKKGILPVGAEKILQNNFKVIVDYKSRDGMIINPTQLTQGTDFVAEVTVTNTTGSKVKDIALTEIFPSGWEVVNTRFTDFGSFRANSVAHTDIRDDRVHFYFDLKPNESKTMTVLLNASYLGTYYLPGVQCEAMYDNDYMVRSKGKWVEVVR